MTDLEMTKLCAEAMEQFVPPGAGIQPYDPTHPYDPLHDDAQAMTLLKKLGLTVDPQEDKPPFTWRVVVADDGDWDKQICSQGSDLNRAIVECVAKMAVAASSKEKP